MSKTVLEQALEHLLNKEEDKASSLLHDYYVGIGRKVYEDIMADDIDQTDEQAMLDDAAEAVEEVEADLVEVEDDSDDEMSDSDEEMMGSDDEAVDDMAADMDAAPESEPVDNDAADVADAMVDVESALAKLKAEFESMLSGADDAADVADAEKMESIEEAVNLEKVAAPANNDEADEKHSPVAGKNPMMARPAVKIGAGSAEGVASGTKPAAAPKAQDQGGTTKPALSKVKA